jgi:hypothetical protein
MPGYCPRWYPQARGKLQAGKWERAGLQCLAPWLKNFSQQRRTLHGIYQFSARRLSSPFPPKTKISKMTT